MADPVRWKDKNPIGTPAQDDRIPITDISDGNIDKYLTPADLLALTDPLYLSSAEANDAYQPLDSDLTAIAALTTQSYGRSLLTLANATALAAEVDSFFLTPAEGNAAYQPLDSDLTAIAALSTDSFGRGLLTQATGAAVQSYIGVSAKDTLTADRTYFVRTDGSDSNAGTANTAGGAWLTLQKAASFVAQKLDLAGFTVTVQVADGAYTAGVNMTSPINGNLSFIGNTTTPANVTVTVASNNAFVASNGAAYTIKGFKISTTGAGGCIYTAGGSVFFDRLDFGACAGAHMTATNDGRVESTLTGSYTISGGAVAHVHGFNSGTIVIGYTTITLTGTPAFSSYFLGLAAAVANFEGTTFSGSATGSRFTVHKASYVDTGGQGFSFFPGNAAGSLLGDGTYNEINGDAAFSGTVTIGDVPVYPNIPQNSQNAAYTTVLTDAQKHILHPTADNNARTFTIAANASVAYPIGTAITFVNQINTVTIAINSDTMVLAGAGTTGSRTLAANGMATALKIASTVWFISGSGLT